MNVTPCSPLKVHLQLLPNYTALHALPSSYHSTLSNPDTNIPPPPIPYAGGSHYGHGKESRVWWGWRRSRHSPLSPSSLCQSAQDVYHVIITTDLSDLRQCGLVKGKGSCTVHLENICRLYMYSLLLLYINVFIISVSWELAKLLRERNMFHFYYLYSLFFLCEEIVSVSVTRDVITYWACVRDLEITIIRVVATFMC